MLEEQNITNSNLIEVFKIKYPKIKLNSSSG